MSTAAAAAAAATRGVALRGATATDRTTERPNERPTDRWIFGIFARLLFFKMFGS